MRELAEWHASRHDPPVQGDPVLGRSGEIITFHWCLGQWLGVGWCSNLLFEKLLHCYSPVESLWRAWSVHMGISRAHTFVFVCISSGIAVDKTLLNLQHDSTLQLTGLGIWCRTAGSPRSWWRRSQSPSSRAGSKNHNSFEVNKRGMIWIRGTISNSKWSI